MKKKIWPWEIGVEIGSYWDFPRYPAPKRIQGGTQTFHPFPRLPAEIRIDIWGRAARSAYEHGRVHRLGLKRSIDTSTPEDGATVDATEWELEHATPYLVDSRYVSSDSTHATRALLEACHESREEVLNHFVPNSIALDRGGVLRCNLRRDVILLDDMSTGILKQLGDSRSALETSVIRESLQDVEYLGLEILRDSNGILDLIRGEESCKTAIAQVVASFFPRLRRIYLLQPVATLNERHRYQRPEHECLDHFFIAGDEDTTSAGVIEWYSSKYLTGLLQLEGGRGRPYHDHFICLETIAGTFILALRNPPTQVDLPPGVDRASLKQRLRDVNVRVLAHFRDERHCHESLEEFCSDLKERVRAILPVKFIRLQQGLLKGEDVYG